MNYSKKFRKILKFKVHSQVKYLSPEYLYYIYKYTIYPCYIYVYIFHYLYNSSSYKTKLLTISSIRSFFLAAFLDRYYL